MLLSIHTLQTVLLFRVIHANLIWSHWMSYKTVKIQQLLESDNMHISHFCSCLCLNIEDNYIHHVQLFLYKYHDTLSFFLYLYKNNSDYVYNTFNKISFTCRCYSQDYCQQQFGCRVSLIITPAICLVWEYHMQLMEAFWNGTSLTIMLWTWYEHNSLICPVIDLIITIVLMSRSLHLYVTNVNGLVCVRCNPSTLASLCQGNPSGISIMGKVLPCHGVIIRNASMWNLGTVSIYRCRLTSIGIPMLKILNMGIPYLGQMAFILRRGPGICIKYGALWATDPLNLIRFA